MATPLFSDNPPLTEEAFEEYVKEKELEFLRGLAIDYNNREDTKALNRIDLNRIGNDKLALTVSLWQRGIRPSRYRNIPYLINGERVEMVKPYLKTLIKFSKIIDEDIFVIDENDNPIEETNGIFVKPEDTYTYILLKYPEHLLGFITGAIPLYYKGYDDTEKDIYHRNQINQALSKFNLAQITTKTDFIKIVKALPILGLIALALEIEGSRGFDVSSDLQAYTVLVENSD